MKKWISLLSILIPCGLSGQEYADYPIQPIEFHEVAIDSGFWKSRVDTAIRVTIPYSFQKCEETGRVQNFKVAGGLEMGKFQGEFGFNDSDLYKIMEGAAYGLMTEEDEAMRSYLDSLISYIGAAQEADGYLYTAWSTKANEYTDFACCSYDEKGRYINSESSHELYNVGHMYEAAVAHYLATGGKDFLNIAIRNADHIYRICIDQDQPFYPGHQEIEIGLIKLYRVTQNQKYLQLAKEFLDRRGMGLRKYANEGPHLYTYDLYSQDHLPVTKQETAVGHSVRAVYMYAAMADIAAILEDDGYRNALDKLWDDIVGKKLYITGGLGAGNGIEGFDEAYKLPNESYTETCASIANVYWNHRMFLLTGESKYIDVLERTLYNGLISGLSLDGDKFFYPNPLAFDGSTQFNRGETCRSPWFDCSCCPSNLSRFIPSVAGYAYAQDQDGIYVNLFMNSHFTLDRNGRIVKILQETTYPWEGNITLTIEEANQWEESLKIRIPGWVANEVVPSDLYTFENPSRLEISISINGIEIDYEVDNGYAIVRRSWNAGDIVNVHLPMEIKQIRSHEKVEANIGRIAIQRGPLVYCTEGVDAQNYTVDKGSLAVVGFKGSMLNGLTVLKAIGKQDGSPVSFDLIPFYAWGHRAIHPMAVWIPESP